METKDIISILRKVEHKYEGDGVPKEPCDDRPRLQNVLISATVSEDGDNHIIAIPVRNRFQEDWLKAGRLDEIRDAYRSICDHPEEKYQIILKHSEDYSFS